METSGDTIVLCRHCPEQIELKPHGSWEDRNGHVGCQQDCLFVGREMLQHAPLPTGMRGGV